MTDLPAMPHRAQIRRRDLLRFAAIGAGSGLFAGLLAACGGSSPTVTLVPANAAPAAWAAPATTASTATRATGSPAAWAAPTSGKLPSPAPNVPDAYLTPPPAFKSVAAVPGKGSKIAIAKASQMPPPIPRDQNAWWQELEKRMGATLDFNLIPLPQFTEKATALIASGDIPDILLISPLSTPDQYRAVQDGAFTELTSYLAADALKAFPNLAQYPASAWKNSALRNKLWGVPRLGVPFGPALLYRQDWAEKANLAQPKNADDFLALLTAMTKVDPDGNGKADTWGLGAQGGDWSFGFIQSMFRAPNVWRKNADGTLTHAIETPEYKQALAFAQRCYSAGVYHPDAATTNRTQATNALIGGNIGAYADALLQLNGDIRMRFQAKRVNPVANLGALVPPGFDGGKGVTYNGTGFGSAAAFPTRAGKDPERVKELLRVLDYFSAPFGSDEYNFLTFGIEGVHHTLMPDGTRVLNDKGRAEINELGTVVVPPRVLYFPGDPGDAAYLQGKAAEIAALGIDNPVLNAFSATNATKSADLNRLTADRVTAMITGRDPLTALDTLIADWKSRGGDQIRQEYQAALQG